MKDEYEKSELVCIYICTYKFDIFLQSAKKLTQKSKRSCCVNSKEILHILIGQLQKKKYRLVDMYCVLL